MGSARSLLSGVVGVAVLAAGLTGAQPTSGTAYSQDEFDQLLAPIALYPDQLLSQVLIAATYPLEVVEAARFARQNPDLQGEALDQALETKSWDPSVKSLTAFPQVLAMMDEGLDWMQRLGDAFLADEQRVMDTVQSLRRRAQAAGNLASTPQQSVSDRDNEITIAPAQPDVIYVPVYDPFVIYGSWWAPDYPPWFWYPPPIYGYPAGIIIMTQIVFGRPCRISHDHWNWAHPEWHGHRIDLNPGGNAFWNSPGHPPPPGGTWQHAPEHRRGVAYPNAAMQEHFLRVDPNAVRARHEFRGYEAVPQEPSMIRPSPGAVRPTPITAQSSPNVVRSAPAPQAFPGRVVPSIDPGVSRQQAEANAQRGMQSRQSISPVPRPSPAPVPATPPHGGGGHPR